MPPSTAGRHRESTSRSRLRAWSCQRALARAQFDCASCSDSSWRPFIAVVAKPVGASGRLGEDNGPEVLARAGLALEVDLGITARRAVAMEHDRRHLVHEAYGAAGDRSRYG